MNKSFLKQKALYPVVILAMALVAIVGVALVNGNATAAPEGTTVSLEVPQGALVGDVIEAKLVVEGATNLAGFQATLAYDPAQLRVTGARLPEHLGNNDRQLLALGPLFRDDSVVIGAASCPVSDCNALQTEKAADVRGVSGRVELATFSFYVEQPGQYVLQLDGVKLVDPQGAPLEMTSLDAVVDVAIQ